MKKEKLFIFIGTYILLLSTTNDLVFPYRNWSIWDSIPHMNISLGNLFMLIGSILLFLGIVITINNSSLEYKKIIMILIVSLFMILSFTIVDIIRLRGPLDDQIFHTMILFLYYLVITISFILLFYKSKDSYLYFAIIGFILITFYTGLNILNYITLVNVLRKYNVFAYNLSNIARSYNGIGYFLIIIGLLGKNKIIAKVD